MQNRDWHEAIGRRVRIGQIVVGAIAAGSLTFMAMAVFTGSQKAGPQVAGVVTWLSMGFALMSLAARIIIPGLVVMRTRQEIMSGTWMPPENQHGSQQDVTDFLEQTGAAGRLWFAFLTKILIESAILQGSTLFCLVAYIIEGAPLCLLMAGALIMGVLVSFPTQGRIFRWIEDELLHIDQHRGMNG